MVTSGAGPTFTTPALFPTTQAKGEWYFYNAASKTRGLNEFKNRWGNRPNIDNWRRSSTLNAIINNQPPRQDNNSGKKDDNAGKQDNTNGKQDNPNSKQDNGANKQGVLPARNPGMGNNSGSGEITYDDLYANLPLTQDQLKESNDSIQEALFAAGKIYIQEVEDCKAGTESLEAVRSRFPGFDNMDEVLFNLYYCYNKNGESAKAAAIKKLMGDKFGASNFTTIVSTGKDPKASGNPDATKAYERIYDLFIEGNFDQAIAEKKTADGQYGNNYWTPQLLYIEAVYYIRQRDDSTARTVLNSIISQFPNTPLAAKAANLLNVLVRRTQIEAELRSLPDPVNNPVNPVINNPVVTTPVRTDSVQTNPVATNNNPKPVTNNPATTTTPSTNSAAYTFNAAEPCYAVLVLTQVDPVFCNEAKNAFARYNRDTYSRATMTADLVQIDKNNRLLLIAPFKDAQDALSYIQAARPKLAFDILPWLKSGRYYFLVATDQNLELLKANKDIDAYKAFLDQQLPGKF